MTKQEIINYIYERISDKSLTCGCKLVIDGISQAQIVSIFGNLINQDGDIVGLEYEVIEKLNNGEYEKHIIAEFDIKKIIGHPVMIGDIIDYIEYGKTNIKYKILPYIIELLQLWKDKRKPIDEQNIECIEYIYNLTK